MIRLGGVVRKGSVVVAAFAFAGRSSHGFLTSARQRTLVSSLRMSSSSAPRVLVPIADGSEEIETTCITDTLTRFGASVVVASVMPDQLVCTMSRGIKVMADVAIDQAAKEDWDLVALPGGMPGAEHLRDSVPLTELLKAQNSKGKLYGAVCASPAVVLGSHELIPDGMTCYPAPGFRNVLSDPVDDAVVVKDNLITSQGPGTSLQFALTLGEQLFGKEKADEIASQMLVER